MKLWAAIPTILALSIAASSANDVSLIQVDGAIGPATATYISRALEVAGRRNDECLILQLDTPGGLLDSTKEIVQSFYASKVPVVVYVAPSGANAGSAGCFITLAADVAAMAPHTSIGAAHPVGLGPGSGGEESSGDVMKEKMENFAASYIEAIANKRNRNVEWARASVLHSASITDEQALATNAVDLIATNMTDLLQQLNGRVINGRTLLTSGANVVEIPMSPGERVFQALWRPEVMFLLMLVAVYGIIGEVSNPGAVLPGVVGAIALILALYMTAIIPVNAAGLALMGLAIALFIVDVFAPTHGVLTVGGIVSFFLGALMLFDKAAPGFRLSLAYIIPATVVTAAFFIFVVGAGLRAQFRPVQTGHESMPGKTAVALGKIDRDGGKVFIEGEYWNARSDVVIEKDQLVEVVKANGLTLQVKPKTR